MLEFAARTALEGPESSLALAIRQAISRALSGGKGVVASIRGSLSITTPGGEATTVMFTDAAVGSDVVSQVRLVHRFSSQTCRDVLLSTANCQLAV